MTEVKQEPVLHDFDGYFHAMQGNTGTPNFVPEAAPAAPPVQVKMEVEDDEASQSSNGLSAVPATPKEPKKRGRPKKVKDDVPGDGENKVVEKKIKADSTAETASGRKRRDRFNGMPEEEVVLRLLPDHLALNLEILIVGINPGLFAAYVGHHYAGPGNHFWKCLYLSGLIPEPMNAYDDFKLISYGIGFTNICARTTKGSSDLKKAEIKEGAEILRKKIQEYKPRIVAFNGKGIYEVFSGNKNFHIGKQPEKIDGSDTILYVMPSSSARCAQLPRAVDKVPFYVGLRKLRDYFRGDLPSPPEDSDVVFPNVDLRIKGETHDEPRDEEEEEGGGGSGSANSPRDLTLEQIQNQAEYQEALIASAEGLEMPEDSWGKHPAFLRGGGAGLDDKCEYTLPSPAHPGTLRTPTKVTVKEEQLCDDYSDVAISAPAAHKVTVVESNDLDLSSASPQYTCLGGDLPAAGSRRSKVKSVGGGKFSSSSMGVGQFMTPSLYQHSLARISHSGMAQGPAVFYGKSQPSFGEKGIQNFSA